MARWELIDSAAVPGATTELRFYRRGDEFSIRVPGMGELMASRTHGSEDQLGTLAVARIAGRPATRLLVGGLGMGFTLAAALAGLAADARVTVAELVPAVVTWNEGPLGACAGRPLDDPRVELVTDDVGHVMRRRPDAFDAIVLDVDNGPEGLTRRGNDALYDYDGLGTAHRALKPGGTLAVWSASPDRIFTGRLMKCGFDVEEQRVRAHGNKGARHVIWFATRAPV